MVQWFAKVRSWSILALQNFICVIFHCDILNCSIHSYKIMKFQKTARTEDDTAVPLCSGTLSAEDMTLQKSANTLNGSTEVMALMNQTIVKTKFEPRTDFPSTVYHTKMISTLKCKVCFIEQNGKTYHKKKSSHTLCLKKSRLQIWHRNSQNRLLQDNKLKN